MIIAAAPQDVRDEISASRTSGLFPLVCKLFVVYGPGSLMERELGLKAYFRPSSWNHNPRHCRHPAPLEAVVRSPS